MLDELFTTVQLGGVCVCVLTEYKNCVVAGDKAQCTRAVHGCVPVMQLIGVKCEMEDT